MNDMADNPSKEVPMPTTPPPAYGPPAYGPPADGPQAYGPQATSPPIGSHAVGGVLPSNPYQPGFAVSERPIIVTAVAPVGPQSCHMTCTRCQAEINTVTKSEPGMLAYVIGAVICLFGCWCGCCLIPCCMDECMTVQHTCPSCNNYLGEYRR